MQKTKYLLLALLVLILLMKIFSNGNSHFVPPIKLTENIIKETSLKNSQNVIEPKLEQTQTKQKPEILKESILTDKTFDEDPLVNLFIYTAKYGSCITIEAREKHIEKYNNLYLVKWTDKQKDYFNKTKQQCQLLYKKYPVIKKLMDENQAPVELYKHKSIIAEYLNFNKFTFTTEESLDYLTIIGQNYPDLIPHSLIRTYEYNKDVVIPDLKMLIPSLDERYIYRIEEFATILLACQQGANCSNTSQIMSTYCGYEENFCTDDFITLFENRLSPGFQADVLLALPYFKKLYGIKP